MSATRDEAAVVSKEVYQITMIQTYAPYPKTVLENKSVETKVRLKNIMCSPRQTDSEQKKDVSPTCSEQLRTRIIQVYNNTEAFASAKEKERFSK